MNDAELRHSIYEHFAATGRSPSYDHIRRWLGTGSRPGEALQRLHEAHAIVLDADGSIRMALPFSGVPTDHRVMAGNRSWWANCAWDTLAIPAALETDVEIRSQWLDTGEPVELSVTGGELERIEGFIHFAVPARRWWDDIVET